MLETIEFRVGSILMEYPALKKIRNIKTLIWYYWVKYDGLKKDMNFDVYNSLTTEESISRGRRHLLELEGFVDPDSVEKEKEYHEHYSNR